ncbi:MAG: conjugal transfer protein [Acidimicrobiales bacterium]
MASIRAQLRQSVPASEATLARGASFALWGLVILAGVGGLSALVRSTASSGDTDAPPPAATTDAGRWVAAGFAERYVGAYLLAGSEGTALAAYLGYEPELPATARPAAVAAPVRTVDVTAADDDYWSVVVAVGPPGQEWFWRAAVDATGDAPVAVGLPSAVAAPPEIERIDLDVNLGPMPADDPAAETVAGFLAAYLCGSGELSRYLSPGVDLTATNPAMCTEVELTRWGSQADGDTRQTVVVDAALGSGDGNPVWQATYAIELTRRDGRWEVAELLPAPPRDGD